MKSEVKKRLCIYFTLGVLPFVWYALHTEIKVRNDVQDKTMQYMGDRDIPVFLIRGMTETERNYLVKEMYPEIFGWKKNEYMPYNANRYIQWRWKRNFMNRAFK